MTDALRTQIENMLTERVGQGGLAPEDATAIRLLLDEVDRLRAVLAKDAFNAALAYGAAAEPNGWPDETIEVRRVLAADGRMLVVVGPFSGPPGTSVAWDAHNPVHVGARIPAALASPQPDRAELDVERLARAIRALYDHPDYIEADGFDNGFWVVAQAIAAEYARLAADTEGREP